MNSLIPQRDALSPRIRAARPARSGPHDAVQAARFRADAHAVAHALELGREPLELRSLLQLRRPVPAAHARRGYGSLDVHVPAVDVNRRQPHAAYDRTAPCPSLHHTDL